MIKKIILKNFNNLITGQDNVMVTSVLSLTRFIPLDMSRVLFYPPPPKKKNTYILQKTTLRSHRACGALIQYSTKSTMIL